MKLLRYISRIIIGLVFIFSGVVKAIDPLGSAYKFHDYFQAFSLDFLDNLSLPLAILLSTAEFIAGFAVLSGIRYKTGVWVIIIMALVFTPLTFILALYNPVSDCGCFGDAIHLTNWETFLKNIIILALAAVLFTGRKKAVCLYSNIIEWTITGSVSVIMILFSIGNLKFLPALDFLPYKPGINIAENMVIPEGAPVDEYNTTFIYQKNGVKKEFTLENYPANDTSWVFVDQKSVLIKKGYQPPIHDFIVSTINGEDITQKILANPGYTLLMISKKLSEPDKKLLDAGFELGQYCSANDIDFYILTASPTSEVMSHDKGLPFCMADETTLKTMVRANPGYILIKEGTIAGKWSWAGVPQKQWFAETAAGKNIKKNNNSRDVFIVLTIVSIALLVVLLSIAIGRDIRLTRLKKSS